MWVYGNYLFLIVRSSELNEESWSVLARIQWKHFMGRNESLLGGQTDGLPLNTEDRNLEKNS